MAAKCPKCGGTNIDQYRMPYGPMWCMDCGFRVEEKMEDPNPFLDPPRPSLGAALAEWMKRRKRDGS